MTSDSATIVALATAPAAGAVGILRVSGPAALEVGRRLAPGVPASPTPRHAYLASFVDAAGAVLDEGLFLYFQAPRSFTGEDVVELQAHGSPRLLRLLLARALEDERVRPALPGEFTRRAFLNGRIDLTRAEAVADLVAADSEAAVRAAAAGLSGALAERIRALETPLRELHADLEGVLNFPDEAEGADAESGPRVTALRSAAEALRAEVGRGRLVRQGARVALYGPVNAGKSTLFNRLVGEARALVDDEPGTTRDALEARVEWDGLGVTLYDTAGLREAPGRVEALGIARTRELLAAVDLAVLVLPPGTSVDEASSWTREAGATPVLSVTGKCDVMPGAREEHGAAALPSPAPPRVSGLTGEGVEALRTSVLTRLWGGGTPSAVALVSERHADALRRTAEALGRAEAASRVSTLEVLSGEVGLALEALGEVSGTSVSEALLDTLFHRFCIGK
ncbi:tRNA uridine-5-carboxymethylaminomethyl(34) synthesis GTPase MnmE [Corallococcus sp. AB032C]|uniref:tRNA uridine-5-carboxymethylaminomethyl(34) synthesis GTPase MnmE n=1 Tax=Corallococcus TaxID=83461 RepID=UPI000EBDD5DE|nr:MULTISPECIES: tRNA uridine-5-carboxymethylaminomethyl(34) synthesis GTPase MnmE [Corallococcus]NPC47366.1 tRNA uridine-5-carboxymethylaminomethyl(34) synthesis GTPase MnmE [Corallococcus exiguus]RKH80097.1 tRNA uridine-5-carboxymethylaminomethyl(34) synthesis GTPase MnmE [Corallococcus sp. AB032C]